MYWNNLIHYVSVNATVPYNHAILRMNATIGSSARNAPLRVEIVHCKCGLEIVSATGVIIICCALNILAGWIYVRIINAAIIIIIIYVLKISCKQNKYQLWTINDCV